MPTKEDLESELSVERQKVAVLANLVQVLQRKYQDFYGDVQAHVANAQNQVNQLDAEAEDE